ncbi:DASH complex subunit Dad3-domain-containing protein [Alternaria rosae]|uniref:DASH complex subunit Dad3-domain-containing protein n=1 Tax=Alternaria rosae TaxID=1187941 RepID=UPI001E8D4257|nr:DASH complex subunit Dad3-domain-containing protein [Alternaria rosae]KAH6860696.1 DASH complex subunit Dad3-domain-containing protein [Alternaria rosae]
MASEPTAASGAEQNFATSQTSEGEETLSPLEQEVLDEYARLLGNLNNLSSLLLTLSNNPSAAILDGLRGLERKTSLVFTLLKASVYSIVLNQQIDTEGGDGEGEGETEGLSRMSSRG